MLLQISLTRDVENVEQANSIFEMIRVRLQDHPEVKIRGMVSNHFPREETPPDDG